MSGFKSTRLVTLVQKALAAAPELVMHPSQAVHAARGAHWATLNMLDKPWIRELQVNSILDIGANTGQFASACPIVFPGADIFSFEPLPDCFATLNNKMKGTPGFHAFNVALGDHTGTATFHRSSFAESSSLLEMSREHKEAFPWTAGSTDMEVPVRTIDSFLPELTLGPKVLLKIDVQGFEERVLRGASDTLALTSTALIEVSFAQLYEGEASFRVIDDMMRKRGFQFEGLLDQLVHPGTARILQGDAIYRRSDDGR